MDPLQQANVEKPTVLISVPVIAADTDERAKWLTGPSKRKFLGRQLGEWISLPSPDEAEAYPYTAEDQAAIDVKFAGVIYGSPDTVAKALQTLFDDTAADELMITTQVYDHADRRRSYELVAGLVGAERAPLPAQTVR
jgi:alkanesulfonate monooxygenase SsuD/methylene tetrahydromethanopterin reductase-like flavin-dependent oxidoreductase (luciferase family)